MNKIYLIKLQASYCEDDGFVIIAKDKEEAWNLIKPKYTEGIIDSNITKENIEEFRQVGFSYEKKQIVLTSNIGS